MKSSTIRRSALSKESMDVIENLANEISPDYSQENNISSDSTPGEYQRESETPVSDNKSKEIDLLWQTFKSAQFTSNSTFMHVVCGFILGVISTLLVLALAVMIMANTDKTQKFDIMSVFAGKSQVETQENIDETSDYAEQNIPADEVETPAAVENNEEVVSENEAVQNKSIKNDNAQKAKSTEETVTSSSVKNIKTKKYIIKDGDTVEAIIKKNYGSYTPERAEAIMKVNNLKNLDHISIDQELLLPIEK